MSTAIPTETRELLSLSAQIVKRNQATHRMLSFNMLKTHWALNKFRDPRENEYLHETAGKLDDHQGRLGSASRRHKRTRRGKSTREDDSEYDSREMSFSKGNGPRKDTPSFDVGGFKSFEIERIQDSHFSEQFSPIFEKKEEHESANQHARGDAPGNENAPGGGQGTLASNEAAPEGKGHVRAEASTRGVTGRNGNVKISFKNDPTGEGESRNVRVKTGDNLKVVGMGKDGDVRVVDLKGKGEDIHLTIKEEVVINETIVTEYDDDNRGDDKGAQRARGTTPEVEKVLLSSVNQSRGGQK